MGSKNKSLSPSTAINAMRKLFPRAPLGVYAGRDDVAGTVVVGAMTLSRRMFRWSGRTYAEAIAAAKAYLQDERNHWSLKHHGLLSLLAVLAWHMPPSNEVMTYYVLKMKGQPPFYRQGCEARVGCWDSVRVFSRPDTLSSGRALGNAYVVEVVPVGDYMVVARNSKGASGWSRAVRTK